jgi:hypothetical protein
VKAAGRGNNGGKPRTKGVGRGRVDGCGFNSQTSCPGDETVAVVVLVAHSNGTNDHVARPATQGPTQLSLGEHTFLPHKVADALDCDQCDESELI